MKIFLQASGEFGQKWPGKCFSSFVASGGIKE